MVVVVVFVCARSYIRKLNILHSDNKELSFVNSLDFATDLAEPESKSYRFKDCDFVGLNDL